MRRRVSKNAQSIDEVQGAPIPTRPITKACRRECSACTNYHRCQYLWIERSRFWVVNTSCKVRSAPSVHAMHLSYRQSVETCLSNRIGSGDNCTDMLIELIDALLSDHHRPDAVFLDCLHAFNDIVACDLELSYVLA